MAYDGRYDDPKYINAFLADLRISDEELAEGLSSNKVDSTNKDKSKVTETTTGLRAAGGIDTPAYASPQPGSRAPPPTPETAIWRAPIYDHLPPISEDQGEERKDLTSTCRQSTPLRRLSPKAPPFSPVSAKSRNAGVVTTTDSASGFIEPAINFIDPEVVRKYQEQTINQFKADAEVRAQACIASAERARGSSSSESTTITRKPPFPSPAFNNPAFTPRGDRPLTALERAHLACAPTNCPISETDDSSESEVSVQIIVDCPQTPESFKSRRSTPALTAAGKSSDSLTKLALQRSAVMQNFNIQPSEQTKGAKHEAREDAVYFSNWGAPSARRTPPAGVRKITMLNVPPYAGYTFIQSLIYGGAIDEMKLYKNSRGMHCASVLFTNPDSCDQFCKNYPDGICVKYDEGNYQIIVEKGRNVNVISGVLRTYLDFGATRVVKVTGVDHDWTMKALYKIGEGKNGRRTVETIWDSQRSQDRIITFRFTGIVDAVNFRAGLVRDPEWKHTEIAFAADPCEGATDQHVD